MALSIRTEKQGTKLKLILAGKLSTLEAKDFDTAFAEVAADAKEALLDFSGVDYISSAGLRSLFLAKKKMMQQGGELKVLYPTEDVMSVFKATRYDNVVTIVERGTADDAPVFYPLRPVQRWMVDTHFQKAQSTMMNTGALIQMDVSIDMEVLAAAVNSLLEAYDIFRCRLVFHPENGEICQRFDGEVAKVYVETLSDEALEQRKQELKLPYELIDHPLYRIFLMKTASAKYLYVDFYHAIMDGTAIVLLFWRDLDKRYTQLQKGEEPKGLGKVHLYSDYILEEKEIPAAEREAGHAYWRQMVSGFSIEKYLPVPDVQGESDTPEHEIEVPFAGMEKGFFKGKSFNENTFFIAATLLALAKASRQKEAILGWVHNGRMTSAERRLMGLMLDQFPLRWSFDRDMTVREFLQALEQKITEGMQYRKSLDIVYEEGLEDGIPSFILQKGSMGRRGSMKFAGTEAVIVEMPANEISAADNTMDIEMNTHDDGTYSLVLDYDNCRYTEAAMRRFAAAMEKIVYGLQDEDGKILALLD
ncbi:condensation domain-containing protein [Selenomonas ruminantium]|uniref:Anti-anti-sigma factor n=1 Tax=Selenomonas ruminantium TaxID=971 RepID=A0A1H0V0Y0_SELRU|nr:condensation domain-containing protein [Selenomonas ruminantium]SDP71975.1 anti-anti-sigma factor [Selenomonas ruminantium]